MIRTWPVPGRGIVRCSERNTSGPPGAEIAIAVIDVGINDWTKNPHYCELEIDIQAELLSRLSLAYSIMGFDEVIGIKRNAKGHEMTYRYSHVACEPCVPYKDKDGLPGRVMPDIVIWDDLPDPRKSALLKDGEWPILWACELKYMDPNAFTWDLEKLELLLDQEKVKFGCWLTISRFPTVSEPSIKWDTQSHGARLWKCTVAAPEYPQN